MSEQELVGEYFTALADNFGDFAARCFTELHAERLIPADYIDVMTSRLVDVHEGKITRLIMNVPPRHLKSLIASTAFPAWHLGHNPAAQIMCVSYGADLAQTFARDTRAIMTTDWYQRIFPETRLISPRAALDDLITTKNGRRLALSVGGAVTGRGADIIIIDDPLKPEEAASDTCRKDVNDWYDGTLASRLNDQRRGGIVIVMQRVHQDDLVGHVLQQEAWEHLRFPAIAEEDEALAYMTCWGPRTFRRRKGDPLHPERQPLNLLDGLKRKIGNYFFAAQYQQRPAPLEDGFVKPQWFPRYDKRPEPFDQIVQSWDSANKAGSDNAYSVCTTWGVKGKDVYLLHVFRQRLEFPELKKTVLLHQRTFSANVVLVEEQASGIQLIQELNRDGLGGMVKAYKPTLEKKARLIAQTPMMEEGRVHLPEAASWLDAYIEELVLFPSGQYADQVDSTSQFLAWFNTPMQGWGIYDLTRRQALGLQLREESWVRLKAPPGLFGSVQTLTGRHAILDDERTIVVCEEDARHLCPRGWTRIGPAPVPKELRTEPECQYAKGSMEYAAWEEQKRRSEAAS